MGKTRGGSSFAPILSLLPQWSFKVRRARIEGHIEHLSVVFRLSCKKRVTCNYYVINVMRVLYNFTPTDKVTGPKKHEGWVCIYLMGVATWSEDHKLRREARRLFPREAAGMGRNGVTVTAFLKVPPPSQGNCICNCPISEHMYRTGNAIPAGIEKFPFSPARPLTHSKPHSLRGWCQFCREL